MGYNLITCWTISSNFKLLGWIKSFTWYHGFHSPSIKKIKNERIEKPTTHDDRPKKKGCTIIERLHVTDLKKRLHSGWLENISHMMDLST